MSMTAVAKKKERNHDKCVLGIYFLPAKKNMFPNKFGLTGNGLKFKEKI